MGKITGKNAYLIVEDSTGASQVVSPYLNAIVLKTSGDTVDVTSFGSNTREQLPTLKDWSLDFTGFYSEAEIDAVFAGILGGSTVIQFGPAGSDSDNVRYSASGVLVSYKRDIVIGDAVGVGGTIVARSGSLTRDTWPAPPWYTVAGHTCVAAYQANYIASEACSYATSLVNKANPGTYDLTTTSAPSWSSLTGWTFNGSTNFLDTGITPTSTSWTIVIQYTDANDPSWSDAVMGTYVSSSDCFYIYPLFNTTQIGFGNGAEVQVEGTLVSGIAGIAGKTGYVNGLPVATIPAGANTPSLSLYIGGANGHNMCTSKVQKVALYNNTLDDAEMLALYNAMLAYDASAPYSFLMSTFVNAESPAKLYLLRSKDGITWVNDAYSQPCYTASTLGVRDPNILYHDGKYWIVHTHAVLFTDEQDYFRLISSPDRETWTVVTNVDCSAVAGTVRAWSPEWFVDSDDSLHVIISLSMDGTTFALYEVHPTNEAMTTWSEPVAITGTGFDDNMLEGSIVKIGSNYYLWYKHEQESPWHIARYVSTSPFSGYVLDNTSVFTNSEGQSFILHNDGTWWFYTDGAGATEEQYSISADGTTGWSALTAVTAPIVPSNATVIAMP